jgi:hypothetical protein
MASVSVATAQVPSTGPTEAMPPETAAPAAARPARPPNPLRDPNAPGFVKAKELPDGAVPPPTVDGNFIIGPTHNRAPEFDAQDGVPKGTIYEFTMNSTDSKIYPGIVRDPNTFATADPKDPTRMVVTTSHPAPYTRHVSVYVPKQYVPGTAAPFLVGADGMDRAWATVFDNMIAAHRLPAMVGVFIGNGGGDAQGSERGLEYDTMSGLYAEFVEKEVLPLVEKNANVKLTKDPDGRATVGASSGGSAAMIMAVVPPGVVSPRVDGFRYVCESAMAAQRRDSAWCVGVARAPDSGEPGEAVANMDGGGRPRQLPREFAGRPLPRLGDGEREHGEGADGQGISLPVCVCAQCGAYRPPDEGGAPAGGAGVCLAGVSDCGEMSERG